VKEKKKRMESKGLKNVKNATASGETATQKVQKAFKQLLGKVTAVAKTAESKVKGTGRLVKEKGFFSLLKKKWYYFALVMIIFTIVIPLLTAKGLPNLTAFIQFGQGKEVDQRPLVILEEIDSALVKEDLVKEGAASLPGDLFNEQEALNIATPAPVSQPPAVAPEAKSPISLAWPVTGEIVLDYGFGLSKAYGDYRFNPGLNLAGQELMPVKAAASGKVLAVGEDLLYNKYIEIEHSGGLITRYGNLAQVEAAKGDRVESGAVIGKIGQPGYQSLGLGTSLFFQVKLGEQTLDPKEYLTK
jgi:murein DD-endopeptidase MepM/ murein hydrolase activator NlpD